jgi:hypothetical protein
VFAEVPEHVGFDIEVKMATPRSCPRTPQVATLQRFAPPPHRPLCTTSRGAGHCCRADTEQQGPVVQAEVDRMVDAISGVTAAAAASGRRMMFSSFDPDVCAALRQRQQRIPVRR